MACAGVLSHPLSSKSAVYKLVDDIGVTNRAIVITLRLLLADNGINAPGGAFWTAIGRSGVTDPLASCWRHSIPWQSRRGCGGSGVQESGDNGALRTHLRRPNPLCSTACNERGARFAAEVRTVMVHRQHTGGGPCTRRNISTRLLSVSNVLKRWNRSKSQGSFGNSIL